ncbi:MAG: hypothetical protein LBD27_05990, partial [Tannerella sp.]|nr:hypothetical protein [Tannerella sp.]
MKIRRTYPVKKLISAVTQTRDFAGETKQVLGKSAARQRETFRVLGKLAARQRETFRVLGKLAAR